MFNPILDLDQAHNDEVRVIGPMRGLIRVNLVEVDWNAASKRNTDYIRGNIARRKIKELGDTPCKCQPIPSTVPCTDCGAGL